ncbi:MAG TPA: dihydropteroate synthase [Tissierellia bacterium]|nr:dihydropteroate synthase [Tissierellia bacterium]
MKIMGILNVTPDSFSDGSQHNTPDLALAFARQMVADGADIIDLGGESTRPGHRPISDQAEIDRIVPVLQALEGISVPISIDTYKVRVARAAIEHGATILNDIWGFQKQPDMAKLAAEHQLLSILMHNQTTCDYHEDLLQAMQRFFDRSIELALSAGLKEERIVLDPGIGFGKTWQHNWQVLRRLDEIIDWGYPVLLGTSRKGMYGALLGNQVSERLAATLATSVYAFERGVAYLRVHDVKAHDDARKVWQRINDETLD